MTFKAALRKSSSTCLGSEVFQAPKALSVLFKRHHPAAPDTPTVCFVGRQATDRIEAV
jgi:hypothetical protein